MKVSNEFVEVKIGNRKFTRKNMILNTFLKKIFDSQIYNSTFAPYIGSCYLKLNEPLNNVDYDSILQPSDFDISLAGTGKCDKIVAKNSIKTIYKFDNSNYSYNGNTYQGKNLDMFDGQKITAIGFGQRLVGILAFIDTSNMNIIINSKENFEVTRVDNFQSDGVCNDFDYPLHLVNNIVRYEGKFTGLAIEEHTEAQLYSVGFGNVEGLMEEEYLIEDVEIDRDDYSITFNIPRTQKNGAYPSENLRLGFYPIKDNSKYLIFKYRLYRKSQNVLTGVIQDITYLDQYYTMSKPNTDFGDLNIKLKIERG